MSKMNKEIVTRVVEPEDKGLPIGAAFKQELSGFMDQMDEKHAYVDRSYEPIRDESGAIKGVALNLTWESILEIPVGPMTALGFIANKRVRVLAHTDNLIVVEGKKSEEFPAERQTTEGVVAFRNALRRAHRKPLIKRRVRGGLSGGAFESW
jgi:hypothetical protein